MHQIFRVLAALSLAIVIMLMTPLASAQLLQDPVDYGIRETNYFILKTDAYPDLETSIIAAGGSLYRNFPEIGYAAAYSTDPNFLDNMGANGNNIARDLRTQYAPGPGWTPILEAPTGGFSSQAADPNFAFFRPCQWYLDQIDAPGAWALGQFGAGIKVAVLDSGIDPNHIDLVGRVDLANSISALSYSGCTSDFGLPDLNEITDRRFHGTAVSAEIASNGLGMASVAPDAQIVAVKVLDCFGSGSFLDLVTGLLHVAALPDVQVVNMSLGANFPKNLPGSQGGGGLLNGFLNQALSYTQNSGKLLVSSSGNDGVNMDKDRNTHFAPAQNTGVLSAWAGDHEGNLASYSNFGRSGTWVGAGGGAGGGVPGGLPGCPAFPPSAQSFNITACASTSYFINCSTSSYIGVTGTSFSSPLVAGVGALAQSSHGNVFAPGDLKSFLKNTADDLGKHGRDVIFSHGRVNAFRAVTE